MVQIALVDVSILFQCGLSFTLLIVLLFHKQAIIFSPRQKYFARCIQNKTVAGYWKKKEAQYNVNKLEYSTNITESIPKIVNNSLIPYALLTQINCWFVENILISHFLLIAEWFADLIKFSFICVLAHVEPTVFCLKIIILDLKNILMSIFKVER